MTLTDLLAAATPRPWVLMQDGTVARPDDGCVFMGYPRSEDEDYDPDTLLIVALVNHAEEFVALWDAAEWWVKWAMLQPGDDPETHRMLEAVEALRPLMEGDSDAE